MRQLPTVELEESEDMLKIKADYLFCCEAARLLPSKEKLVSVVNVEFFQSVFAITVFQEDLA